MLRTTADEKPNAKRSPGWDQVRQLMANRPPVPGLQALTPQTIGYALTDPPVGQLVWIAERFAPVDRSPRTHQ